MNKALIFTSAVMVLALLLSAAAPWASAGPPQAGRAEEGKAQGNALLLFTVLFAASLVGLIILFKR